MVQKMRLPVTLSAETEDLESSRKKKNFSCADLHNEASKIKEKTNPAHIEYDQKPI